MVRACNPLQQHSQATELLANAPVQPNLWKRGLAASRQAKSAEPSKVVALDSIEANNGPSEKPKMKVSNLKRKKEDVNVPVPEPGQPPHAKRTKKMQPPNPNVDAPPARRSVHTGTTIQTPPKKRKRRTKAQILADKAKANAEKLQLKEQARKNEEEMRMMDIEEDISQAGNKAHTFRKFSDIENESGEEFVGYNDIKGSGSEAESDSEDAVTLKVRMEYGLDHTTRVLTSSYRKSTKVSRERFASLKLMVMAVKKKDWAGRSMLTWSLCLHDD